VKRKKCRAARTVAAFGLLLIPALFVYPEGREDFSFIVSSGVEVPFGSRSAVFNDNEAYRLGASAGITGLYIFPNRPYWYMSGLLNYQGQSTPGTAPWFNLISGGMGTGANLRIGRATSVQTGIEAGGYLGVFGDAVGSDPFAGVSASLSFDFSPSFFSADVYRRGVLFREA